MRPRKEVLLLMRDEFALGMWRHRVELWGYRSVSCLTIADALDHLRKFPVHAIATTQRWEAEQLMPKCGKVLLFDVKPGPGWHEAHAVEWSGADLVFRVRERLRILTALKRGPAKGTKKPCASVGVEEQKVEAA